MDCICRTHHANIDRRWINGKASRISGFLFLGTMLSAYLREIKNILLRSKGILRLSLIEGANTRYIDELICLQLFALLGINASRIAFVQARVWEKP